VDEVKNIHSRFWLLEKCLWDDLDDLFIKSGCTKYPTKAQGICYTFAMAEIKFLNLKDVAIDESNGGLDPNWLLLSYEMRLQRNLEAIQRGINLEEAIKNKAVPQKVDRSVHYNILRDAF
jgi:hypothetical protein